MGNDLGTIKVVQDHGRKTEMSMPVVGSTSEGIIAMFVDFMVATGWKKASVLEAIESVKKELLEQIEEDHDGNDN